VIDRARIALNRPLEDGDRPRLFAIAAGVIVTGALVLALVGRTPPRPASHEDQPPPAPTAAAPAAPPAAPALADPAPTAPPSEEAQPNPAVDLPRREQRAVKQTARTFLAGYLAFSYGHAPARRIRGATGSLRSQLAAHPPRVPPRERRRRPRVVLLQLDGAGKTWAGGVALVDDRARRYSVGLTLARRDGAWQVTRAGE
jgi:hypothetical protein